MYVIETILYRKFMLSKSFSIENLCYQLLETHVNLMDLRRKYLNA